MLLEITYFPSPPSLLHTLVWMLTLESKLRGLGSLIRRKQAAKPLVPHKVEDID